MKKTLLLSIGFLLGLWTFCHAQEQKTTSVVMAASGSDSYAGSDRYTSSPQTWSATRYGDITPNLYTGTVSANIPLYTYQDDDFTLPIALGYASDGYTPNIQANYVGLGWGLEAGGQIVQTINGVPDMDEVAPFWGNYRCTSDRTNRMITLDPAYVRTLYHSYAMYEGVWYMETEPDIFTFNFMGHSGKFMYAGKKLHVFDTSDPEGEYKIEYKRVDPEKLGDPAHYYITITTGDGFRYKFEWLDQDRFFREYLQEEWESLLFKSNKQTRTWYLCQVTAPNGRFITFEYERGGMTNYSPGGITISDSSDQSTEIPDMKFTANRQDIEQLKKINIDNRIAIDFKYGTRNSEKCITDNLYVATPKKLDTIRISRQAGDVLKECYLQYTYGDPTGNPVLLLSAVKIWGDGTYRMEYHKNPQKPGFPFQQSPSFDHWGYYNAGPAQNGEIIYPPVHSEPDNFAEEEIPRVKTNRASNDQYAMQGMLIKMTYPTGGYTTFEYEPHTYGKILTRTRQSKNLPSLIEVQPTQFAGGLRVKKITNYPLDGQVTSKTYNYTLTGKAGGKSSGNLLVKPFYFFYMKEYYKNNPTLLKRTLKVYFTRCIASFQSTPNHIEYERVAEKYDDGSYTVYDFANYSNFPDKFRVRKDSLPSTEITVKDAPLVNNFLLEPDYEPQFRGTLLAVSSYDKGDTIRKKKTFTYDTSKNRKFVESVKYAADYFYVRRIYPESYRLVNTVTEDYYNNGLNALKNNESYVYNSLGQIIRVSRMESNGSTTSDYITYVSDLSYAQKREIPGQLETYDSMLTRNVLNLPIYKKKSRTLTISGNTTEQLVEAERFEYGLIQDTIIRPYIYSKADITTPINVTATPTYYPVVTHNKYDLEGRLLQSTDRTGVKTCYVWGYGGFYLIAKVVGVPYLDVLKIIGTTEPYEKALTPAKDISLRQLKGAFVTTYEYSPYVGVTKIKDPSGRVRGWQYDFAGRLIGEYGDDGRYIRQYDYSVANNHNDN